MLAFPSEQAAAARQCIQQTNDAQVLVARLKACSTSRNLKRGKQVHEEAATSGRCSNIYVASTLIDMYAKCGEMVAARRVFDSLKHVNLVSWNVLIMGYADNGESFTALHLFRRMQSGGVAPDSVTFVAALKACASLALNSGWAECIRRGEQVHNLAVENGCDSNIRMQTTLLDMYAKSGSMVKAQQAFDSMRHSNEVSWNVLILGHADNGLGVTALELFRRMNGAGFAPDHLTFLAALKACTGGLAMREECLDRGKGLHNLAMENGSDSDVKVQSTLIDMYAKCGCMENARTVFDSLRDPDVVCWNALMLGYADNGQGLTALELFTRMRSEGPAPSCVTFTAALKACGLVGGLEFGRSIHSEINRDMNRDELDVVLVTCLVDFYAKCGCLVEAQAVFALHPAKRNIVTWTALLAGFSSCGDDEAAFQLFRGMQDAGLLPNSVTFLCILAYCNHAGLVDEGKEYFHSMAVKYGIPPAVEHYNCMVDILGRADKLDDAMALLERMPCAPNNVIWMTVLAACRKWKNLQLGRLAFQSAIDLYDRDTAAYALMGQIYRARGMLQEQRMVLVLTRRLRCAQEEACWVNALGRVHTFSSKHNTPSIPQEHKDLQRRPASLA